MDNDPKKKLLSVTYDNCSTNWEHEAQQLSAMSVNVGTDLSFILGLSIAYILSLVSSILTN